MSRPTPGWSLCMLLAMVVFGVAAGTSLWHKSATADEPTYLAAGLRILQTGDITTNEISSPYLLKPILALPAYLAGERIADGEKRLSGDRLAHHWQASWEALHASGMSAMDRLRRARFMNVILALITGLVLWAWGRERGGPWLGVAAMTTYFLWPETLAHARFASLETGITLLTVVTLYLASPILHGERYSTSRWLGAGFFLGLTFLAKTSAATVAVFLVALVLLGWLGGALSRRLGRAHAEPPKAIPLQDFLSTGDSLRPGTDSDGDAVGSRGSAGLRPLGRLLTIGVVCLLVVNTGFLFQGSFQPAAAHRSWSDLEKGIESMPTVVQPTVRWAAENVPVPLPDSYINLLVTQARIVRFGNPVFFHGESQRGSWWWYPAVGLFLKTPLAMLLLLLAGTVVLLCIAGRAVRSSWTVMWAFPLFLLLFLTWTDRSGMLRYFLPALPCLSLVAGVGLLGLFCCRGSWRQPCRIFGVLLLAGLALETGRAHPNYLAFTNATAGGTEHCHEWLADSNCDWGQDLPALADAVRERNLGTIALGYFGSGKPEDFGLIIRPLPSVGLAPPPGQAWWFDKDAVSLPATLPDMPVVVSVTLLRGAALPGVYTSLANRTPTEMLTPTFALFMPPHAQ